VEHVMDFGRRRQSEAVGNLLDALHDLLGPVVFRSQLAAAENVQQRHGAMEKAEPDPLPHGELERSVMVIVEGFVMLLRLLQQFMNL
jgi:hypothetical protein